MPTHFRKAIGAGVLVVSASLAGCGGEIIGIPGGDTTGPQVKLVSPEANSVYSNEQVVLLEAIASDDVGVTGVDFYDGSLLMGSSSAPPFRLSWTLKSSDNGIHSLTARARDAAGNEANSEPVEIAVEASVTDTEPPSVAITSPASAQTITAAQTLELEATASDNVEVVRVEFHDGATLLGTVTQSPYTFSWALGSNLNGVHSVTAKAFDAEGLFATSAPVEITVNVVPTDVTPPTVTLTAPAAGVSYTSAQAVTLSAVASDDVGVTRVEFFNGTTRIGAAATSAPYSVVWNITSAHNGTRTLTAKAYDAAGNMRTSSPRLVSINISGPGTGTGTTYFVSTSGSDSNSGSQASPFKTIAHAVSKMIAGDTTYVRGGTYKEGFIWFRRAGTQTAPIKLLSYPGEAPIIDFVDRKNRIYIKHESGANVAIGWITIDGFEIRNGYDGIKFHSTHNSTFRRNKIHHNKTNGILGQGGHHNLFDRNIIHHNGNFDTCHEVTVACAQDHGIYAFGRNYVITNNIFYYNIGFGLQQNGYSTSHYTPNRVPSPDFAGAANWIVANNVFAYSYNAPGLVIWDSESDNGRYENNIFYENKVTGSASSTNGIHFVGGGQRNNLIRNNIFYASGSGGQVAITASAVEGTQYTQSNNWFGTNPAFVNGGSNSLPAVPDFRLKASSPAIDKGLDPNVLSTKFDFAGGARPQGQAYDIGAYEFGAVLGNGPP